MSILSDALPSNLQKNLPAVHPTQDEKENQEIAEGKPNGIVFSQIAFKSVAHGMDNATEVDSFSQHIGSNGVHTVNFQPFHATGMPLAVYPVIEQPHQQEAVAAGEQGHAA